MALTVSVREEEYPRYAQSFTHTPACVPALPDSTELVWSRRFALEGLILDTVTVLRTLPRTIESLPLSVMSTQQTASRYDEAALLLGEKVLKSLSSRRANIKHDHMTYEDPCRHPGSAV